MVFEYKKIILLLSILATLSCHSKPERTPITKRNIPTQLQCGDIAFRRGNGFASDMVVSVSGRASYSHIGAVVQRNGEWYVAHAVPFERSSDTGYDRVECEPIATFFAPERAAIGAIYRYNNLDSVAQTTIANYLLTQVERATPFDHKYNLADTTQLYCSEYVWQAYLQAGIDISNGRRSHLNLAVLAGDFILPCDIALNDSLSLVWQADSSSH